MAIKSYRPGPNIVRLFMSTADKLLVEGSAGTGKTTGLCALIYSLAERYPKSRYLMCRKTRASMTESVLVTWERDIVPDGHACKSGGAARLNRHSYTFPNGSEVVIGGMDNPDRIMSTEYDVVCMFEATEFTREDFDHLLTRVRNHRITHPLKEGKFLEQIICDCNPSYETHWLNKMAQDGLLTRIKTVHTDNPTVTEEYLDKLKSLQSPDYERLYLGLWVSAAGAIYPQFSTKTHVISGEQTKSPRTNRWTIWVPDWHENVDIAWTMASVDWGWRNPGGIQVWGIDRLGRMFMMRESYRVGRDLEWWADKAESLRKQYGIMRFECDPSRPEAIYRFNVRLGRAGGYQLGSEVEMAGGANNARPAGISLVSERLSSQTIFFLDDALEERDPQRVQERKPCGVVEEIPSYRWREIKDGQAVKEEPDPTCEDHGCDMTRYACAFVDVHDWAPGPVESEYPAYSWGRILGHDKVRFSR